ncbi:MAG: A/G-specific adenine glycosylase [Spirochaetes bacterium]|nr:A/G-specific adenine glycosylase [Spirochaetota bacterium]
MGPLVDESVLKKIRTIYRTKGMCDELTTLVQQTVYAIQQKFPRNFPWRISPSPYEVFVSEIMLQQTHAQRVAEIYPKFIRAFPNIAALANADLKNILQLWKGLGYNRRAIYLHKSSQIIVSEHGGVIPANLTSLRRLPGIGNTTAASICAFAFNMPVVFIETNIRTVFIFFFFERSLRVDDRTIYPLVECCLDRSSPSRWYNALMDAGHALKQSCKSLTQKSSAYRPQRTFIGSWRQLRGNVLGAIISNGVLSEHTLAELLHKSPFEIRRCLFELEAEGFLIKDPNGNYAIK